MNRRKFVRFTPKSGHVQCTSSCPLSANSGHWKVGHHILPDGLPCLRSVHCNEIRHLERLVEERIRAAVETERRQRPLSNGREPIGVELVRRLRPDIECHAAVCVLSHLTQIVRRQCCLVGVTIDKGKGGAVVDSQRPELLDRHVGRHIDFVQPAAFERFSVFVGRCCEMYTFPELSNAMPVASSVPFPGPLLPGRPLLLTGCIVFDCCIIVVAHASHIDIACLIHSNSCGCARGIVG